MSNVKLILAIGTLALAPAVGAQTVDTSGWKCEYCPFEEGHQGDYELGASSVSDDSAYIGNATGYDEEGAYANVDADGGYASDRHRVRWYLEDAALDSRVATLDGGRPGKFDYNIGYSRIPYRRFITTSAIFEQATGSSLTVPAGWVTSPTTAGFTALGSSLVNRPIESDRDIFEIGGRYRVTSRFSFSADYRRQEQDGLRIQGGSSFTNASLLPMPFDYVTDEVDLGVRYGGENGFVSVDWYLSDFQNDNTALTWDQPFTALAGAETAAQAQAPDSRFRQLTLAAGYSFPEYRTVISASASTGEIEQDAVFLPYTTNPNAVSDPLPRSALDAEIDTTNFAVAITSRVFRKGRIKLNYRFDERDNEAAQDLWNRVIVDAVVSGDPEMNIPYSFERSSFSLKGDYDLLDTLRLSAGWELRELDRDFQEVASQDENTGWGRARWRPVQAFEVDFRAGTSKREVDDYNETIAANFGQNPLMRKYNLADRFREFGELVLTLSPAQAPVSITLSGLYADDDYSQSQLGLTEAEELNVAADLSWAVSETASLYLNAGYETLESAQFGSELFAAPDWRADNEDTFTSYGVGFIVRQIGDRFDIQIDYTRSEGESQIDIDTAGDPLDSFPDLETTLDYLRVNLAFRQSERLGWNLDLRYQRFEAEDWALQGVGPGSVPLLLSLGALPYDDESIIVGLGIRYNAN